jgi:hypothetical protein
MRFCVRAVCVEYEGSCFAAFFLASNNEGAGGHRCRNSWRGQSGVALAQTTTPSSSTSPKIDDVSKCTSKQWNRAKAEWERKKKNGPTKKQSQDQNLTGRNSWSFLASCMTS